MWRRVLAGYFAAMAVLVAARYLFPSVRVEIVTAIELLGVLAMLAGVARNRPATKLPWLMLAAANLTAAVGELVSYLLIKTTGQELPYPSWADLVYLLEYPLFVAAFAIFIRRRSSGPDRRGAADALILAIGLGLLSWLFLVHPEATNSHLSWAAKFTSAAYPVGDLLMLASLIRLLSPGSARGRSVQLLTIGTLAGLASDVVYDVGHIYGWYREGTVVDLGWMIAYIAWGAAAMHPTMRELTERGPVREPVSSTFRLVALMLASLTVPIIQFARALYVGDAIAGVLGVGTGALFMLMLSRLWVVAASHRRGTRRERTLRIAAAELAAAGTVDDVVAVARAAAAALRPPRERGAVLLSVRDGQWLRPVEPGQPVQPGDPVDLWLKLADGQAPRFVPMADIRAARRAAVQTLAAQGMPKTLPGLSGFEGAMLFPLALKERPSGDPFIGMLAVFGRRRVLVDLAAALAILAGQAALAVERVTLSQEVVRQRGETLFRTLVQDTSDVILILADDGRIRYATPSAAGIFGDDIDIEGSLLADLVAPSARDDISRELDRMRGYSDEPGYEDTWRIKRRDGRSATLQVHCSDLRGEQTVRGLVLTLRDVTEQRQLEDELKHRAFHDALTGLPNRVLFADRAARALDRARIADRTAGVLFVDLDDFKVVNDTMGHAVGDELLVAVGARLASSVRASDTAARLGGDEFALLIEDAADAGAVQAFAERIVAAFESPFMLSDATVLTTATVGVASTEDSADVDELLRHADLALYAAKAAGKRRWRHYQPVLSAGMIRRREVQAALEEAVRDSAFTLAYQPIVGLASGEIAGYEALVRWPHPRWGMLLPGQFIELAEETGHIVPLGAWVLKQALTDLARWRKPTDDGPYISVNVSARQFRDPGFVASVRSALNHSGMPSSALVLELTESALLGRDERVRAELQELKNLGVRLAIDDFGTGYSSLSYLLELPMHILKIDKTFVTGISSSHRRLALVEGIISIASTLSLEVTAEGIETETQRQLLANMGCQYGQGYLLSVPVDATEAEKLLRRDGGLVPELPQQRRRYPDGRYLRS